MEYKLGSRAYCRTYPHQYELMAGFLEDSKKLIDQVVELFNQNASLRFEHFVTVWKEMSFSLIFTGRKLFRELWEFTECTLRMTKEFFLSCNDTAERVAALYLLYSLYFKQPVRPRVKISLTLSDYEQLNKFVQACRNGEQWDVPYVWIELVNNYAFAYVAIARPVGLEIMAKSDSKSHVAQNFASNLVFKLNLDAFQDTVKSLNLIHEKYVRMKTALTEPGLKDPALKLISDKLPNKLLKETRTMQAIRGEIFQPESGEDVDEVVEGRVRRPSIGERRKQIRDQAFGRGAMTERNKLLMAPPHEYSNDQASDLEDDKVRVKLSTRGHSRDRGKRGSKRGRLPGRPSKPRPERSSSSSPSKIDSKVGIRRGSRGRGRGQKSATSKIFNDEFAKIARSLEASKQDPNLLEGLIPGIKKIVPSSSATAVDVDDKQKRESPRKALINRRKKLKLEVRLKKKHDLRLAKKALESQFDPSNNTAGPSRIIETKKPGLKKKRRKQQQTGNENSSELQQTEVAIGEVAVPVPDDDPLAGLMEVVEEHPAPEPS